MSRSITFQTYITVIGDSPEEALKDLQEALDDVDVVVAYTTETYTDEETGEEIDTSELM